MNSTLIPPADTESVNFREIRMGNIAPNTLYRSSHPIKDNKQDRTISLLAANARIQTIINLSDSISEIMGKSIFTPWYNKLLGNGRVLALGMDFSFDSANFRKKLKSVLQYIPISEGPWLIHCHAGVDRTGFVSLVLEALMGASMEEIINDYLKSFNSIYNSNIFGDVNKTDSLVVMRLLSVMSNHIPVNDQNLQAITENYLKDTIKLSISEIELLKGALANPIKLSSSHP